MDGWTTNSLGELCDIYQPKTISKKEMDSDGDYPVFGANGIIGRYDKFNHEEPQLLITCRGATCGSVNISDPTSWITGNAMVIRPKVNGLSLRFLEYLFRGGIDLSSVITGAAQPQITRKSLAPITISFPPLHEQERIVAILDEAFAAIATATANAKKNLANAQELFESQLNRMFRSSNTAKGGGNSGNTVKVRWPVVTLTEVCTKIQDGAHRSPQVLHPEPGPGRFPYLTSKNIRTAHLKLDTVQYCETDFHNEIYPRCNSELGDVLLTKDGANTGNVAINTLDEPFSLLSSVCLLKPNPSNLLSAYLCYYIQSKEGFEQITGRMTGTAIKRIILKTIKSSRMPLPPLSEQERIVAVLNELYERTCSLGRSYKQKLTSLSELKQSILQKAFKGELTANMVAPAPIPFPATIEDITSTDLHAGILAIAYRAHEANNRLEVFGHVKGEKIAHMVEAYVGVHLGRNPVKDAAGPNDYPHLIKVEHRANKAGYFSVKRIGDRYELTPKHGFDGIIEKASDALGDYLDHVKNLIALMLPMNTQQSEIFATVHAAWNNLLLDGIEPSDEAIVQEAREDWHPKKLKIDRDRFVNAIKWIRAKNLEPKGLGKKVLKPRQLKARS